MRRLVASISLTVESVFRPLHVLLQRLPRALGRRTGGRHRCSADQHGDDCDQQEQAGDDQVGEPVRQHDRERCRERHPEKSDHEQREHTRGDKRADASRPRLCRLAHLLLGELDLLSDEQRQVGRDRPHDLGDARGFPRCRRAAPA
jgi:hypothetical protein